MTTPAPAIRRGHLRPPSSERHSAPHLHRVRRIVATAEAAHHAAEPASRETRPRPTPSDRQLEASQLRQPAPHALRQHRRPGTPRPAPSPPCARLTRTTPSPRARSRPAPTLPARGAGDPLRGALRHRGRPPVTLEVTEFEVLRVHSNQRRPGGDVRIAAAPRVGQAGPWLRRPEAGTRDRGVSAASWATTRPNRPTCSMSASSATACPDPASGEPVSIGSSGPSRTATAL